MTRRAIIRPDELPMPFKVGVPLDEMLKGIRSPEEVAQDLPDEPAEQDEQRQEAKLTEWRTAQEAEKK
jgi:hypothetical protein